MKCKLCGSEYVRVAYKGVIRDGNIGNYTVDEHTLFQCEDCGVIWHDPIYRGTKAYYESNEYRESMGENAVADDFYRLHDKETLAKLTYTGTDIFRHKCVADIGCGGGAFLDFVSGVANEVIAVEPTAAFWKTMKEKGYHVYAYMEDTLKEWANKVDVATSFDVIEHVENPVKFVQEIYNLLSEDGQAFIGTPTDAPLMRELLGKLYEKKQLFSTQHLWVFNAKSLCLVANMAGCPRGGDIYYHQRYGISNLLGWLRDKKPKSEFVSAIDTHSMNGMWHGLMADLGLADYIVMVLRK